MDADAEPTTLDHRPARRALIGWACATLLVLLPSVLSAVAVLRAWQAPPLVARTTGQAAVGYATGELAITVATPSGLTQLVGSDPYARRREQAIVHLSAALVVSGHPLAETDGIDASAVRSVARNGGTLAFAFSGRGTEARAMLLVEGADGKRVLIPGDRSWLMGLHAKGAGFGGYVGRIDAPGNDADPRAAFLSAFAGRVRSELHDATIDASAVRLGAPVNVSLFQERWVTDVMFIGGGPIFVVAGGPLGGSVGYARPDGAPVTLPPDSFAASALRLRKGAGTFVARDGKTRPYLRPESGLRLCAIGDELEPIDETTSGDVVTTTGCGHVLRVRADGRRRYREVQVDDHPWRPLGSGMTWWGTPIADPIGDRWLVRGRERLRDADEVLVFDMQGDRIAPPSRAETLWSLAGAPSTAFVVSVIVSWVAAIAAVVLLVRALRRVRRVRVARASPTSPRPGLYTGVLEANGRQLRITVGFRLIDHVVALSEDWPRRCVFSGTQLGKERVQLVGLLRDAPPSAGAATPFREAAPAPSQPTLVPATEPPIIGHEHAAEPYVSRAFVPLVIALVIAVPLSAVLLMRLGLGPY